MIEYVPTLIAAIVFAMIFLFGRTLRLPARIARHHRKVISFAAGMSVAYVFLHLLPELETASAAFLKETQDLNLLAPAFRVYLAAMLGFMLFYGLSHMVAWSHSRDAGQPLPERGGPVFALNLAGFAFYVWMTSYLLVRNIEEGRIPIVLYAVAMGAHFLTVDHALRHEHGRPYERAGKTILALASMAGWGLGCAMELPKTFVITLVGFISGGVIMNSMIMELPRESEGRFWFFLAGGGAYAALLIPLA
jgi:hypothetical protein